MSEFLIYATAIASVVLLFVNLIHLFTVSTYWIDEMIEQETLNPFCAVEEIKVKDFMKVFFLPSYILVYVVYVILVSILKYVTESKFWNKKVLSFKKDKDTV